MQLWRRLTILKRNLTRSPQLERELDDEIQSYRQLLEDEKTAGGADPARARREALLELGGAAQIQEQVRDVRIGSLADSIASELRHAARALLRNPGLTVLGALMLALGMGATTVVFSVFYAALIQPLPFREPGRIVEIAETRLDRGWKRASFTAANFWDVRSQSRAFQEVAAYHFGEANLTGSGPAEKVTTAEVTAGFFRTLGVAPVMGRDFSYEEDRPGAAGGVVILGNRFWTTRFSADPHILGKTLRLNDRAYTVIGILPHGQPWIDDQTYVPFIYRPDADRDSFEYGVVGRLAPGITLPGARADLERIAASLAREYPRNDKGIGFALDPASSWVAADSTRRALWVLLGAVGFLLLIACVNIANLLLARGMSRKREIAVRTALGASRARLMRLVLTESMLLSLIGAALGLVIAYLTLNVFKTFEIRGVPRLADAGLNPWVLAFTAFAGVLTGLVSGLAPALQAPSGGIAQALREGDRSQAGSRGQRRLRGVLVAGEVALSFLLLVGAGLLMRSFMHLLQVDRGFQTENRLVFSVSIPGPYYKSGAGKQFTDRFLERLSALPQVIAAGGVSHRPISGGNVGMGIVASAHQNLTGRDVPWASWRLVSPGYFQAMGLPLRKGRLITARDDLTPDSGKKSPIRVVISERLAKLIFPGEDPIGKHAVLWKGQNGSDGEVIGVVGDMRERGLAGEPTLAVYLPTGRSALPQEFIVHTSGDPLALVPTIRSIAADMDPNLPVSDVRSLDEIVSRSVSPQRFNTILLAVFSALALLLATTGIYGVLAYSMSRRTSEIGLRVALGAGARSIVGMTLAQGMRPAVAGIVLGAGGAFWLSRYLETLLFGVKPLDLPTYCAVAAMLLVTALLACYIPARRATRIDPSAALRIE